MRATFEMAMSSAAAIRLSLHPSPASPASAFNRTRARVNCRAGCLPLWIRVSSRSLSSALSSALLRQLEQRVHPLFPLVQRRRVGSTVCGDGRRSGLRIHHDRLHHCPGAPACGGQKGGPEARAIGRSRGGLTTKIHAVVDALGNPLRFILTPGQASDITQAETLIEGLPAEHVLGDKGYDCL